VAAKAGWVVARKVRGRHGGGAETLTITIGAKPYAAVYFDSR